MHDQLLSRHAPTGMPLSATGGAGHRLSFWAILAIAIMLRVTALFPASMHHPDEIFQYLEPAHRMLFGDGIVTWEYRLGMRSWAVPDMLAIPMALGQWIAPHSDLYLLLPRLLASLFSLSIPLSAYVIGKRYSPAHGLVAMAATAFWFEAIYFSAHILTEGLSTAFFLPAAALMLGESANKRIFRRYMIAGLLLGIAVIMRFHYGPAFAIFVILTCRTNPARWLPLIAGGIVAMLLSAAVDMAHGQFPFRWILVNFEQNILHDRASAFGVDGPLGYLGLISLYWRWAMPLLLIAMVPILSRDRALFATALVCLLVFSAIGHKEYRFVMLGTTILVMLAAIGSVEWLMRLSPHVRAARGAAALAALMLSWASLSAVLAATAPMASRWTLLSPRLALVREAGRTPALCGFAINRDELWSNGGYSYLHRNVPLYMTWDTKGHVMSQAAMVPASAAFNMILSRADDGPRLPAGYTAASCHGTGAERICLFTRAGGCDAQAARYWNAYEVVRRNDMPD